MDPTNRIEELRRRLATEQVAACAVAEPANVAYITGFDGVFDDERAHVALVTASECVLFTDSRYAQAAREAARGSGWQVEVVKDTLWATVEDAVAKDDILAIEDSVPHRTFLDVSARFGERLMVSHRWVEDVRIVKSPEELVRIEAAQGLTDRGFSHILDFVRAGTTEKDIALELEFFLRREGSEGVAFPPIVASGPNSAFPHAKVTGRTIEPGDFVKMDFGARVDGYCADMTRTVVVGKASDTQREIYDAVLRANRAGIEAARPGLPGKAIDAVAREVIESAGYGAMFGHGLGHGVGLEVHEAPGVGPRSAAAVPLGSVITIEPGVYVEGLGGVRIEDLVVVEESGARVLTGSPKTLIEL